MASIPACHAGDRGSIPRRGDLFCKGVSQSAVTPSVAYLGVSRVFIHIFQIERALKGAKLSFQAQYTRPGPNEDTGSIPARCNVPKHHEIYFFLS